MSLRENTFPPWLYRHVFRCILMFTPAHPNVIRRDVSLERLFSDTTAPAANIFPKMRQKVRSCGNT